ncbi:hypothetical protein D0Z07_4018 [Hyphodiscus hymeniophilus]|uniref:Uncharacterized protein n=1 Tax=Hyphodiscus hymeniophilus TaxID=353542 RepID=A0A9P6VKV4_9HELO|nr:hypothetical protein D0Z07_4018 [Hyphodiscus hymeniophilus]
MESLPPELVELILLWTSRMCRCDKNNVLPLRHVSKAFNTSLRPYVLKTIQLEFSRFLKGPNPPSREALAGIGGFCQAVYLDMMVVRDEEEISRLGEVFHGILPKVPEMGPLLDSLRRYCMSESTFDEADFKEVVKSVMDNSPNMHRLKLNLPFQVVGRASLTATLFLATTLACVATRSEEFRVLETLVIDHVSDTTILNICNNPIDARNALACFAGLKHLVLSIKRQETRIARQKTFSQNLWLLIRKAAGMESLCLIGWNVKRDIKTRKHRHAVSFNGQYWLLLCEGKFVDDYQTEWSMRSLPYPIDDFKGFPRLRYLELKRVDINPECLVKMITNNAQTLKELYLNEVYIKVFGAVDLEHTSLWIGYPDIKRPDDSLWVAEELRETMGLSLDILRVTGLGYDDFEPDRNSTHSNYDLNDPTGLQRSFDQRFVEAVFGNEDIMVEDANLAAGHQLPPFQIQEHGETFLPSLAFLTQAETVMPPTGPRILPPLSQRDEIDDYDADTYQRGRNTTSKLKRCIDGYFFNHNEQALKELQRIITVADRGMALISQELIRSQHLRINPVEGLLETPAGDAIPTDSS